MTQSPPPDQGWSDRPATTDTTPPASTQWSGPATTGTGTVAVERRPGRVTAASIILIVLGALVVLFGLLALLGGALIGGAGSDPNLQAEVPGLPIGALGGALIVVAIILLAWGILEILAGANALGGRNWARITGIVLSVIGLLLFVLGLVGSMGAPQVEGAETGGAVSLIINVVIAAAYAFVIWAYATSGSWFASRAR